MNVCQFLKQLFQQLECSNNRHWSYIAAKHPREENNVLSRHIMMTRYLKVGCKSDSQWTEIKDITNKITEKKKLKN